MNLGYLFKILRQLRAIRRRHTPLDRKALARAYLKTQLKYFLLVRLLHLRPKHERVMGYRVSFFDYATFAFLFEEIFANEQYRLESSSASPVVLDCGANIGIAVLYFKATHPGARVLAFEPDARTCEVLRRNVADNRLSDVEIVEAALSDRDGTTDLYHDPDRPGSVLMTTKPGTYGARASVRTVRLSSSIGEPVDFLKMDIEGAESVVLAELAAAGKLTLVREMALEYSHHHPGAPDADELSSVLRTLETSGFGYQLSAPYPMPLRRAQPQNVLIYAYRKDG